MKPELEQKLYKECPELFKFKGTTNWPINYGIDTEPGWDNLVTELCYKLEPVIKSLPEENRKQIGVVQIKEKFGGLRVYLHYGTQEMQTLINDAVDKSFTICEMCGNPGKLITTKRKWLLTYCNNCNERFNG